MGSIIAKMLLPTVSSLAFMPAISVAAKRGFHMEAMVYFFTMFFIAVRTNTLITKTSISILIWMRQSVNISTLCCMYSIGYAVVFKALGDFDEPKRSTLTMFGVLTAGVRIYQDRWGYGVYSGPIGTAVLMITVKWLRKMKEKKGLYPEKSVYTQQVGPGFCFGALALMLKFYFEEWDYTYVHSFYHVSLAMAFVLVLPKTNRLGGTGGNPAKLSCYTLCCCV
ncbi:MYMK protein, partial [Polyodon spathula]|nr:MYMK protein [Polyodon spathula]